MHACTQTTHCSQLSSTERRGHKVSDPLPLVSMASDEIGRVWVPPKWKKAVSCLRQIVRLNVLVHLYTQAHVCILISGCMCVVCVQACTYVSNVFVCVHFH